MKVIGTLLGLFFICQSAYGYGYGGLGLGGYGGLGFGGYGGYGVGVAEVIDPVIPVSSGIVDIRAYTDSFIPGSSYCGYGTYGPAYGGGPYPLEAFGPVGFGGYGGLGYGGPLIGGLGYGGFY